MDWFSGTLKQTSDSGWQTFKEWHGVSFTQTLAIAEEIRKTEPDAHFEYHPYPTTLL